MLAVLELFGGIGLFLFGMSLMGSSLEKLAGSGLEKILETLTTSKKKGVGAIKGWALGLGVTAVIQSSAATTIMLIGFVNAGIMKLPQAIPVVFGANIGSTMTAQILRLGDLSSDSLFIQLLKPSSFAPMLAGAGAIIHLLAKKQQPKNIAGIFVGLGTLFYGMNMMEEVFAPLKESEVFRNFFTSFENPLVGILTGFVITAIIQSSSASVGILQALSATGTVTYATAFPLIVGQNIGKCITIILGGVGANKKAKRVALSYLLFNIFGAVVISAVVYIIYYTIGIPAFSKVVNRGDIANVHLGFNLVTSLVLMPFCNKIADLTGKILRDSDVKESDEEFKVLDDSLLKTPGIALKQCKKLMYKMGEKALENLTLASAMVGSFDKKDFNTINENEAFIDECETKLSEYIVKIERKRLTNDNHAIKMEILHCIGDYERIGDYARSIAYSAQDMYEQKVSFSKAGRKEFRAISTATIDIVTMVFDAFEKDNESEAYKIVPLAKTINKLQSMMKSHHVDRLEEGDCGVNGGVILYDLVNSMERIAVHARSIARHITIRIKGDTIEDAMHGKLVNKEEEEYLALATYYKEKYIDSIDQMSDDSVEEMTSKERKEAKKEKKKADFEAEKKEKAEKAEKAKKEKAEKAEKAKKEKAEKAEKANKEKFEKKSDKPEKKTEKAEKKVEKKEKSAKVEKDKKLDKKTDKKVDKKPDKKSDNKQDTVKKSVKDSKVKKSDKKKDEE